MVNAENKGMGLSARVGCMRLRSLCPRCHPPIRQPVDPGRLLHPMTPGRYALCGKPVIGLLMWITSQCVFPPLFEAPAPDLARAGSEVTQPFDVAIELHYQFELEFDFGTSQAYTEDRILGYWPDPRCWTPDAPAPAADTPGLGRELPMRLLVKRVADGQPMHDQVHRLPCPAAHASPHKVRHLAGVTLPPGRYVATVTNLEAQAGLDGASVHLRLSPPRGK